jgi:hypothetical protein
MRALHVIPSLDPADGGPSVVLPKMLAALAGVGIEVEGATTAVGADGAVTDDPRVRRFRRLWRPGKPSWSMARWLSKYMASDQVRAAVVFAELRQRAGVCQRHSD